MTTTGFRILLSALLAAVLFVTPASRAEEITAGGERKVVITASKFFYYRDRNYVEYQDNVRMVDGARVLTCTRLRAYVEGATQKLTRAEAEGNVVMTEADRRALSGFAVYYRVEDKLVLTRDPVLHMGPNTITGDTITFFLKSEDVIVEGNVHSELFPSEKTGSETAAPAPVAPVPVAPRRQP